MNNIDRQIEEGIGNFFIFVAIGIKFLILWMWWLLYGGLKRLKHIRKTDMVFAISPITAGVILLKLDVGLKAISVLSSLTYILMLGIAFNVERIKFLNACNENEIIAGNHKPLKYYHCRGTLSRIYRLGSSVPTADFIMSLSKLSNSLNTNIISITSNKRLGRTFVEIETDKNKKIPEELKKLERLYTSLYKLVEDIKNINVKESPVSIIVRFNSDIFFARIKSLEPELAYRLKEKDSNVDIGPDMNYDFRLIIKKELTLGNDFLKVFEDNKDKISKMAIPFIVGYSEDKNLVILDLQTFAHLLIAGASGNGKSNIIHTVLFTIMLSDKEIELVLCDPKLVELKEYRQFRNVKYSNNAEKIMNMLGNVCTEMDKRNKLFFDLDGVRNIEGYNEKNPQKMKYIVVVVDEFADLLSQNKDIGKITSGYIERLAQAGRSAGIRLILSTQNPTKKVLDGFIKPNILTRIGLGTTNKTDSRTILDNNMAYSCEVPGKFVLQHNKKNKYHFSIYIPDNKLVEGYNYIKQHSVFYGEKKDKNLELINDSATLRDKISHGETLRIDNSRNLYKFYMNMNFDENVLPKKEEIRKQTKLSEHLLRKYHDELKQQGLLRLLEGGKQLKVVDLENEIDIQRAKKNNKGGI